MKRLFTPFPVLQTERLTLRQLAESDINELFALRSNREVNKYLERQPAQSVENVKSFIEAITENIKTNESVYWVIALADKLIGTICLFDFAEDGLTAEIGYELLPGFQGQGYMKEAAGAVLAFGFQHIGLAAIEAHTHAGNRGSLKLLEKFGFSSVPLPENHSADALLHYRLTQSQPA